MKTYLIIAFALVLFVGFKFIGTSNSTENISTAAEASVSEKPSKEELKKKLTPLQYKVTQENGTERAFGNEYWDNKKPGIYVDIVSGEPVFSSKDKFKSGTGWPSFTKPLATENIVEVEDNSFFMKRVGIKTVLPPMSTVTNGHYPNQSLSPLMAESFTAYPHTGHSGSAGTAHIQTRT